MEIIIKFNNAIGGYWDGGKKNTFIFKPWMELYPDKKFIKWGSWEANFYFYCSSGKTNKLSISYAVRRIKHFLKKYQNEYSIIINN